MFPFYQSEIVKTGGKNFTQSYRLTGGCSV